MNVLKKWNQLPECMKNDSVYKYYSNLCEHTGELVLKRVFDVVVAMLLLLLFSPVFLVLAIWIKADSKGPVFFRQVRVTQYGKEFRIFKFRTMVTEAENLGTQVTVGNDMRITKVGRIIRKSRLDEIPQLLNILKGEMTFVGTRPEVPQYVQQYTPEMYATLLLPAGVTSRASIEFKDEAVLLEEAENIDATYVNIILPQKMKYNLQEIKEFSIVNDLKVMFRTVRVVL